LLISLARRQANKALHPFRMDRN